MVQVLAEEVVAATEEHDEKYKITSITGYLHTVIGFTVRAGGGSARRPYHKQQYSVLQ